jgi:DNA-binding beta-propeller fold protein YncE
VGGLTVQGAVYPRPDYAGDPWTMWGQGITTADGRFISAIGDHLGPDGNSYVYEYDPSTGTLATVGDLLSYVEHEPGSWGYGKVHGQMVGGPCGEVYFASYWGTNRDLQYGGSYTGDYLFRLDPNQRTISTLGVPVVEHGIPSLAGAPELGLVYGEAIDPIAEAQNLDAGPFFVYDTVTNEVVFEGDPSQHAGFRNVLVDGEGRAYYSIGGAELAVYDPASNSVATHPHRMPGDWLRASTAPAPDGRVFAVTRDPDAFFVLNPDGSIEPLGTPAEYTATMALAPDGGSFYFMPDAHGDAWQFGGALTRVDTSSGEQEVIAEINPLVEEGLGLILGGTFGMAVSPDGGTLYIGANAGPLGADDGFGEVVLLVVDLP